MECADGQKIQFLISPQGWQQWGNTESVLFRTVPLLEALTEAAAEHLPSEYDQDEDEEDDDDG